jgi:hemerythrin-like domain-containing protein
MASRSQPPTADGVDEALVDTRDMLVAHQAMRREFRLAPTAVRRTAAGDTRRARRVAAHLRDLTAILANHHDGEDRLLWPKLHERVPERLSATVSVMEQQHETIHALLTDVDARATRWAADPTGAAGDELADVLDRLAAALDEHLAAEERDVLPLAAAHLSEAEWQELEKDGARETPPGRLPFLAGMVLYEGDPEVLRLMIERLPLPARLVGRFLAPRVYARRARRIHGTARP